MTFTSGSRVRFRYTGETGTVVQLLDDDMLSVRLDSDTSMLIPAFSEDLEPESAKNPLPILGGKNPIVSTAPPPRRVLESKERIEDPKGVQAVFEPMPGKDGSVSKYKVWLLNDTRHDFLFDFELYTGDKSLVFIEDRMPIQSITELGDILADDLNDLPEIELNLRRITTQGVEPAGQRILKIKPKVFFKNYDFAPILNQLAYTFPLLDRFEGDTHSEKTKKTEDLAEYTKAQARVVKSKPQTFSSFYQAFSVEEFAHFEPEIDLHIQALQPGYARLDKSEILRIQMKHFERFMERAIRLGVPRVFIIHGIGEGKLRDAVAQRLREMPGVVKFKNEYHHKYGYGATEAIL